MDAIEEGDKNVKRKWDRSIEFSLADVEFSMSLSRDDKTLKQRDHFGNNYAQNYVCSLDGLWEFEQNEVHGEKRSMRIDWEGAQTIKESLSVEDPRPIYYFVSDLTAIAFELIDSDESDFGFLTYQKEQLKMHKDSITHWFAVIQKENMKKKN